MRFCISPAELKSAFDAIGKALVAKNAMPVFDNILIAPVSGDSSSLSFTASDGEIAATVNVPVTELSDFQTALIPAKNLSLFIKDGISIFPVEFEYNPANQEWKVCDQDGTFNFIAPISAIEYPEYKPMKEEASTISIPRPFFLDAVSVAASYVAQDDLRPVMCGVYVCVSGNSISVAASDSKLLFSDSAVFDGSNVDVSFILPSRAVSLIKALFSVGDNDMLQITTDGSNLCIVSSGRTLKARIIDGKYPRYEAVIPKQQSRFTVIDTACLIAGMKRVQMAANSATKQVKMSWDQGQLTLYAQDVDFSTSATVKVKCESAEHLERFDIGVRAPFFLDAFKAIKGNSVRVQMCEDNSRPIVIRPMASDSNRLVLVSPMMLTDF